MDYAKFTFFEVATQKGYLMAVLADILPRHWVREVVSTTDGEEFIASAKRNLHDDSPCWYVAVRGRTTRESTQMWQSRARDEVHGSWDAFAKEERARVQAMKVEQDKEAVKAADEAARQKAEADRFAAAALIGASAAVLAPAQEAPPAPKATKAKGTKGPKASA